MIAAGLWVLSLNLRYQLQTYFTMRPKANQIKVLIIRLAVNKNQIGFDVAIAMIRPFACQRMIEVAAG